MLLCLDYDGVIVDSFDALLELAQRAHAGIGIGRAPQGDDFRTIEDLSFTALAARLGISDTHVNGYARAVLDLQSRPGGWQVPLVAGMAAALAGLAARHTLVVVTASSSATVERSLTELGVTAHVGTVLGGESGCSKAQRIASAMTASGHTRQDTWMVGDAISDIRQGKLAGVRTAAVSWGYQPRELLLAEAPDRMLDSPAQLLGLG